MIKEKVLKTSFGNIAYLETTNGANPLVYFHGGFGRPAFMNSLASHFSPKGYKIIAPYYLGHGNSSPLPEKFSYNLFFNSMLEFFDKMAVQNATLFGHSLGGRVAYDLARARSDKVKSLVLSTPLLGRIEQKTPQMLFDFFVDYLVRYKLDKIFMIKPGTTQTKQFCVLGPHYYRIIVFWKMIKTIKPIKKNFSNIPTLILWGEKDAMLPFASQEKFVSFIKNRKIHMFPSGHHYSYLKQPELTLKIMEDFLLTCVA